VEIPCNRELEEPTLVRGEVSLPEPARTERATFRLDLRGRRASAETGLEFDAGRSPGRGRRDQREALHIVGMVDGIEHRQQSAPGIAADRETVQLPGDSKLLKIGYVLSPADRNIAGDGGAASSPLVVVNQLSSTRQRVESGQEIVMMSAGSAVQHDDRRPGPDAPLKDFNAAY